jgi:hypothetical protein
LHSAVVRRTDGKRAIRWRKRLFDSSSDVITGLAVQDQHGVGRASARTEGKDQDADRQD